jgi:hypothetical protein
MNPPAQQKNLQQLVRPFRHTVHRLANPLAYLLPDLVKMDIFVQELVETALSPAIMQADPFAALADGESRDMDERMAGATAVPTSPSSPLPHPQPASPLTPPMGLKSEPGNADAAAASIQRQSSPRQRPTLPARRERLDGTTAEAYPSFPIGRDRALPQIRRERALSQIDHDRELPRIDRGDHELPQTQTDSTRRADVTARRSYEHASSRTRDVQTLAKMADQIEEKDVRTQPTDVVSKVDAPAGRSSPRSPETSAVHDSLGLIAQLSDSLLQKKSSPEKQPERPQKGAEAVTFPAESYEPATQQPYPPATPLAGGTARKSPQSGSSLHNKDDTLPLVGESLQTLIQLLDVDVLARLVNESLAEQARRHGVDLS